MDYIKRKRKIDLREKKKLFPEMSEPGRSRGFYTRGMLVKSLKYVDGPRRVYMNNRNKAIKKELHMFIDEEVLVQNKGGVFIFYDFPSNTKTMKYALKACRRSLLERTKVRILLCHKRSDYDCGFWRIVDIIGNHGIVLVQIN